MMASGILVVQGPRGARKALVVDEAYFGVLLVVSAWLVDVGVTSRLEDWGVNGVVECSGLCIQKRSVQVLAVV